MNTGCGSGSSWMTVEMFSVAFLSRVALDGMMLGSYGARGEKKTR